MEYSHKKLILVIFFAIANIIFYFFSKEGATFTEAADADQYYQPAISLLQSGSFNSDSKPFTFGTPLYSILLAIPIGIFGFNGASLAVVTIQSLLLYFTGFIVRKFSAIFFNKESFLLHALIIFNPNSFITAHLAQSETLFTLILTLCVYFLFKLIQQNNVKHAFFLGILLGLLALTRPAGLYFIYFLPFVFLISTLVRDRAIKWMNIKKNLYKVFVIFLLSAIVISPWYARNYSLFGEGFLSSNAGAYLKDQYTQLLRVGNNWSTDEALAKIEPEIQKDYIENNVSKICFENETERDWSCNSDLRRVMFSGIANEPFNLHMRALVYSWSNLFFTGGASNFRNYLGLPGKAQIVAFDTEKYDGIKSVIVLIKNIDYSYLSILFLTSFFSVSSRIFGLIGIYSLVKDKTFWPYFTILISVLILLTGMYLYLGQSRFRVPMEPLLMLLTVIGIYSIRIKDIKLIKYILTLFGKKNA
jgi:4-amino-4-deoxy-L-arabinose transferase-like glycosyltransferase